LAQAVARIDTNAIQLAIPGLIQALTWTNAKHSGNTDDQEFYVRAKVAETLAELGPEAKETVPSLVQALRDPKAGERRVNYYAADLGLSYQLHNGCRRAVVQALKNIDPGAVRSTVSALVDSSHDADPNVRLAAVLALGCFGHDAMAAIPILRQKLQDNDAFLRLNAAKALKDIDPGDEDALPILIESAHHQDRWLRHAAVQALGAISFETDSTVDTLIIALDDKGADIRGAAASALGKFGVRHKKVIPALVRALKDKDMYGPHGFSRVCDTAAGALGMIGADAKEAIPFLLEELKRKDQRSLDERGIRALDQIDPSGLSADGLWK
jgi:HEAT repeat protein